MRNPNGYGSVIKLGGNRRRPYWVRKTAGFKDNGQPIYTTIGYAETREDGNILLAQYNHKPWDVDRAKTTLAELYELWSKERKPKLGKANQRGLASAYKHCAKYADIPYRSLRAYHMQDCIDHCGRGYSTQGTIKNLWSRLDGFALEIDLIDKKYSDLLTSDPIPPTTRTRFTDAEIDTLWAHQDEPWVDAALFMIYSGWRASELLGIRTEDINLDDQTIVGGVKTAAGKNRIVPIHSLVLPIVEARIADGSDYLFSINGHQCSYSTFKQCCWTRAMRQLGMSHTPHECRHTFESLLDSAGANRRCIDLMMGHVSKDTGNRVYNHKTLEELKANIELVTH